MRNGCARPDLRNLQQPLRTEPADGVCYWQSLSFEDPTGHRKAYCRIAQMHQSHTRPPHVGSFVSCRGGIHLTLSAQYQRLITCNRAQQCHSRSTEVIEVIKAVVSREAWDTPRRKFFVILRNASLAFRRIYAISCAPKPRLVRGNRFFPRTPRRRHHHGRQTPLRRQLLEACQIAPLDIIPTRQELSALPLQLVELTVLSLGRCRIGRRCIHR